MKLRRAIVISVVTYLTTFVIGAAVSFLISHPVSVDQPPSANAVLATMLAAIVAGGFGAWWYLRPAEIPGGAKAGFLFGLVATVTAFILDGLLALGLLVSGRDPMPLLRDSYTHWFFGIMMVVGLVVTTLVGTSKVRHGY
ncbi:MAG: hypothetical protein HYY50_05215 [Candidatus Kerfeldbacteria bacterium]|nr:hypothetical protein [Candidatus Kerfeldbacteria bacterium]